jgi:ethanolaminephosphotransferase
VTPEGAAALRAHRFAGADHSLLYRHVLSPFAQWVLERCVPLWLAPNAITALGIAAQVGALVCLWRHCPTLAADDAPPPWTAALAAAALWFYQTLDNVDGKQARRTGSSSPLGLLFDHGLDAINGAILGPLITTMVVGPSAIGGRLIAWYICAVPFYLNTWEEFHTHEFHLPLVNGPNEGLVLLMGAYAGTALVRGGRAAWAQPASHPALVAAAAAARPLFAAARVAAGAPPAAAWAAAAQPPSHADLLLVPTLAAALVTGCAHVATVARHVLAVRREGVSGLATAAGRLLPFAVLMAAAGAWVRVAPTAAAVATHPWGFHLAIGSSLADLTTALNLAHVTRQGYRPPWVGIVLLAASPLLAACAPAAAALAEPLLWASTVASVSSLVHLCTVAPREVAAALDIDVFDISRQRARHARALEVSAHARREGGTPSIDALARPGRRRT